jgi:hypothetical protein
MARWKFYAGLSLITACTLMMQVLQTRILSVVTWYHLAFLAISMAMFGLTAGAVFVYLKRERFTAATLGHDLAYFSGAFALATLACLAVQMSMAPAVIWSLTAIVTWAVLAICLAVPFFFAGIVVSLALTRSPFPIGRVYGIDLLGAAAGCLGALLLLNVTDGPSGILVVGALGAAAASLFAGSRLGAAPAETPPFAAALSRPRVLFAVLGAAALANSLTSYGLQPAFVKSAFEDGHSHIYRGWNTFSRVAVSPTYEGPPHMWGPSPRLAAADFKTEQRGMNIDGDAGTTSIRFDGRLEPIEFLRYDAVNLAYFLPDRARAAIIGVGGGRDVLSAALFGYRDITAVELNPAFVRLLTRERGFADFTNVSALPDLKLHVDEGRSWFSRTDERFDVLQMSLIDTWAATGAGAFSLSENGLYTVEAWKIFLDRLTDRGVYTVSRWYNPSDPTETARMLSLAVAALLERGVAEPRRHVVLATQATIATLLVSREPFTAADLTVLRDRARYYGHGVLIDPDAAAESPVLENIMSARDRVALDDYTSRFEFDLSPPTDNRPFFFNQVSLANPFEALKVARDRIGSGGIREGNLVASATLVVLFVIALVLVLTTIVVPLRAGVRDVGRALALGGTLYFLFIGFGFMLIEIGLLQRTSVFLGHPVYSLGVLLTTLIVSTGAGSLLSDRLPLDRRTRFGAWAALTALYVAALPVLFDRLFLAFEAAALPARVAVCIALIAPAGLFMGFGFPTGMRLISAVDNRPTPWFWGVNGAAGVLASIVAVACSIAFGISATLRLGAVFYLLLIPATLGWLWPKEHAQRLDTLARSA